MTAEQSKATGEAMATLWEGEFPATARTFVFDRGTVGNYSYLAVPFNAANPAGALVTINNLISVEQALGLSRVQESGFPIAAARLTPEDLAKVRALPRGPATLSDEELAAHFVQEPDAGYLTRLEQDWMEKVLRR